VSSLIFTFLLATSAYEIWPLSCVFHCFSFLHHLLLPLPTPMAWDSICLALNYSLFRQFHSLECFFKDNLPFFWTLMALGRCWQGFARKLYSRKSSILAGGKRNLFSDSWDFHNVEISYLFSLHITEKEKSYSLFWKEHRSFVPCIYSFIFSIKNYWEKWGTGGSCL
jgi:hypothetical protein